MKYFQLSLFFLLMILSNSCTKTESECTDVIYDEPFVIKENQTYCFSDGNQFTVEKLENQFCPCDAVCVWEGQMVMEYSAILDDTFYSGMIGSTNYADTIFCREPYVMKFADIEFTEPCTPSNPSPAIKKAKIRLYKND